jgi:hypothetical protein
VTHMRNHEATPSHVRSSKSRRMRHESENAPSVRYSSKRYLKRSGCTRTLSRGHSAETAVEMCSSSKSTSATMMHDGIAMQRGSVTTAIFPEAVCGGRKSLARRVLLTKMNIRHPLLTRAHCKRLGKSMFGVERTMRMISGGM